MNLPPDFWNNLIIYGGGLITALGLNKVAPAILDWWKIRTEDRRKAKASRYEEIMKMKERIRALEDDIDKHRAFEVQTRSTLNAMLPLMKEMMKDHPNFVSILNQLELNIIGNSKLRDEPN